MSKEYLLAMVREAPLFMKVMAVLWILMMVIAAFLDPPHALELLGRAVVTFVIAAFVSYIVCSGVMRR